MGRARIGSVAQFYRGVSYKKDQAMKMDGDGYIAILRANNISDYKFILNDLVYVPTTLVQETQYVNQGDIIITMSSGSKAHVGKVAIAQKNLKCSFGAFCGKIVPFDVVPKYLYYVLCSNIFRTHIERQCKGTNINNIKQSYILDFEINLPFISEQKRIVTRIEELFSQLDASVAELKTAKERLEAYRQAVYSSIYKSLTDMRPITDFFDITGGLTKNSKRSEMPVKMPYLRVANVYYNHLDLSEIKEIGVQCGEIERCRLALNDLLFVEGNGSKSQIGRVAIWDGSISDCLHQNHLIKGRPFGNMLSAYALYYLISRDGRKQIVDVAKSTSGLYTLSTNKIKNLMIPYCNIDQQKQLLNSVDARLSLCDSIEKTVDTALQQANALRQSILKDAFEGRL